MSEGTALLELDGISKSFGRVVVADQLSLRIGERDMVGIVGPNGAGKTSLFSLISGDLAPYLDLTIQVGTDSTPAFRDCTGFVSAGTLYTGTLANFASSHTGYANGLTAWDPTGTPSPDTRTFRFVLSVQNNNAAVGLTSTFGFSWETQTS